MINESGGPQSVVQSDEIYSDCFGAIALIPLPDENVYLDHPTESDMSDYCRSPTKSDMSDYCRSSLIAFSFVVYFFLTY